MQLTTELQETKNQVLQATPPQKAEPTKIEADLSKLKSRETQRNMESTGNQCALDRRAASYKSSTRSIQTDVADGHGARTRSAAVTGSNAQLTTELQEIKTQLAQAKQTPPIESRRRCSSTAGDAQLTTELQEIKTAFAQAKPNTADQFSQEMQQLQASNAQLTTELQEIKTQLAQAKQTPPTQLTQEMQQLQASNLKLNKELQETNAKLTGQLLEVKQQLMDFILNYKVSRMSLEIWNSRTNY